MRVLAVAQRLHALGRDGEPLRKRLAFLLGEPARDRRVIRGGPRIGLGRKLAAQGQRRGALVRPQLGDHRGVVGRIDNDGHEIMVLGRGADQRRPADVDVLDARREVRPARHRGLEGIEVRHHEIDARDLVVDHRLLVSGVGAPRQDAAMDRGLQGLHPAVHDLGKARVIAHLDHLQPGIAQRLGRAAGRQDFNPVPGQRLAELNQALLVGDGDQRPFDAGQIRGGRWDVVGGGGHGRSFRPPGRWGESGGFTRLPLPGPAP